VVVVRVLGRRVVASVSGLRWVFGSAGASASEKGWAAGFVVGFG
jgi:hypothetical protein